MARLYFGGRPSGEVYDYEAISVNTSSAKALTASKLMPQGHNPCRGALITVESGSARVRLDGGTPTTSSGHLVAPGDVIGILGINNLRNFKASWAVVDAAVSLRVSYMR